MESEPLNGRRQSHTILDTQIGSFKGPNSLHNFASSFTRAQNFVASKIDNDIHKKRSFFVSLPGEHGVLDDETYDPELMMPSRRGERLSAVIQDLPMRNQLFMSAYESALLPNNDVFYQDDILSALNTTRTRHSSSYTSNGIPIHGDASDTVRKLMPAKSFASLRSSFSIATTASHINLKKIEDRDGNVVTVVAGQSTAPQTIFNSINVLIGVGLLALPVGILKAGWVIGVPLLALCGTLTYWLATLLSKSMDTDATIMTYADLGFASYGYMAKLLISVIFSADLIGAGVALIVLLSDSIHALVGNDETGWTTTRFKLLSFFVLTPFTFLPLSVLSVFSLFGIMATISITLLVLACGFLKPTAPGSLVSIMPTNMWPQSIPDLLLAIGILMAPFGGHAIFPNLKSDMRHPYRFTETLKKTYSITLITDLSMGIIGFLMFGSKCSNEITNNLLTTAGYPSWCYPVISGLICLIPLAKTPLNAKPIISTLDSLLSLHAFEDTPAFFGALKLVGRFLVRIGVNALFVGLAILFPEFDRVIGILGASICFLVCVILPGLFYLKLCRDSTSASERFAVWTAIIACAIAGTVGTWAVFVF